MTNERREFLHALDRNMQVQCILDENAFHLCVTPASGENSFLKLEFTKGFALELKAFLNEHCLMSDAVADRHYDKKL